MVRTVRDSSYFAAAPVVGLAVAVIVLVADQISKYVMVELIMRPEGVVDAPYFTAKVIDILPVFQLRMVWNTGISFSLFDSGTASMISTLIIVQAIILVTIIWFMWQMETLWMQAALGFIVGGGLGNIVDRITMGAVADFLHFYWEDWHFPTFNLADTCIFIGVVIWLLDAFVFRSQHKVR